ncbi:NarK/NasA family nitrate transporter [Georgenia wutianyii]|uniref:NarK/NasA family nitrate transporter n=1 Tax=Georgenia wutianyii TaxID=2585135 RepID=A0ABX5VIM7_9MICO|nr:MFS transporter [Georgenia wutianyii]QDB78211.1 NarK/NasA family nitrate transporter [Georgenia wutianyii]
MSELDAGPTGTGSTRSPGSMLALATIGFLVNFWAWNLISPLGSSYGEDLDLTPFQVSVIVAVPVIVGSLGRIPVGALTDRFGARVMFPAVSLVTIVPTLFVGFVANSFVLLVIGGFLLGIGGTAFAVGIPFVNAWYPPARRGLALGVFGMGTAGTAVAAFTTVAIADRFGRAGPFVLVAVVLAVYAAVAWVVLRDSPARPPAATGSMLSRTWRTLRMPVTLQLSLIYALAFGGFVAFSVYLPTYLINDFDLTRSDASFRTAGFIVLAVVARPVGGWLSDRFHPVPVLVWCFVVAGVGATLAALRLDLVPVGTVAFLAMAAALGAASGACFALVAKLAPPDAVGSVTGIVGAAGGLGGFFPPLVMGAVYGATGAYTIGFVLLALSALGVAAFTWWPVRRVARTA